MNTTDLVHYVSTGERPRPTTARPAPTAAYHQLVGPTRLGIVRSRQFLLNQQRADGSWCGQSIGDASLASQWILLLAYLGQEHSEQAEQAARAILDAQLPGGAWPRFPGGPVEVSTSVQAYFALKLAGHDPASERLATACDAIRRHGGADAADATTRYFLALLGQIGYDCCPVLAPEQLLSDHTRRRELAPLFVLWSHRPVRDIGLAHGVRELFVNKPCDWPTMRRSRRERLTAALLANLEHLGWTPLRRRALDRVEKALLGELAPDQIEQLSFHELVLRLVAIDTLGHSAGSEPFNVCHDRLHGLIVVADGRDEGQPQLRTSPLADTALALKTFHASGIPLRQLLGPSATTWLARPRQLDASVDTLEAAWLLETLRTSHDDASLNNESLPPDIQIESNTGIDATAVRDAALRSRARRVAEQFVLQLLGRQNIDGGWAPTPDRKRQSTPDVTGAVLEALDGFGGARVYYSAQKAITYLRARQRADGSWESATGVGLVHGTSLAVRGLLAAGISPDDDAVAAGVNWLIVRQQPSGGWGELPHASDSASVEFTIGRATAIQTAWALLALVAAGRADDDPARRGVQYLLDSQQNDGQWPEPFFTLRDAHSGRFFRNDLQTSAASLMALSRWAVAAAADNESAEAPTLRLVGAATDD